MYIAIAALRDTHHEKTLSILVLPEARWENYLSHHGKEEAGSWSESTVHLHLLFR